jgi:cytochrome P450
MRGIEYQASENSKISDEELEAMCAFSIPPAIDTPASYFSWLLVHLAQNPHVQTKLRSEIRNLVVLSADKHRATTWKLTNGIFDQNKTPYLNAVFRETHRMTPVFGAPLVKENKENDLDFQGTLIPQGSTIILDTYSKSMNRSIVKNPQSFQPERWFANEVEARSGTPAEVLDHPLYAAPYGAGKRMCPGKDIADKMLRVMLSQLV